MPRRRRSIQSGMPYHLISRFVGSEYFIREEHTRRTYLHLLGAALSKTDWRCFAFAIMSNHIHLGAVAGNEPLVTWMREVHGPFAELMNERHARIGSVFVRGPNAIGVQHEGVAKLVAYIHHNPVRAGVVSRAEASDWTSHRAYRGDGKAVPWLDVHLGAHLAGFLDARAFAAWIEQTAVGRADLAAVSLRRPPGRPPALALAH